MRALLKTALLFLSCFVATGIAVAQGAEQKEIDILWSVDVDQRRPNSPAAFSAPAIVGDSHKA
ncbi:MAG: hypothetical protein R8M45_10525, partial [Ghiorsea sp.]